MLAVPLVGEDLRFALKKGVLLCFLIQEIEPGSVPNILDRAYLYCFYCNNGVDFVPLIHENTTQIFKLKENVENFIAAVSEYGVPRHKLFTVNDLFDGTNILFSHSSLSFSFLHLYSFHFCPDHMHICRG